MSILIFTLIFVTGLLLALIISDKLNIGEIIGLPFILGLGYASFSMFFLDSFKIGITLSHLELVLLLTVVLSAAAIFFMTKSGKRNYSFYKRENISFKGFNLAWLVFVGFGGYLAYCITIKCLFWPPAEFDSIEGYDLLAKAIAHEGTIANSVLQNQAIVNGCGPRLLYPPLLATCNAICYMCGMGSPKLITSLFFWSGLISFYSLTKRFVTHWAAAFATFMMMIAPEMFANASFTLTNLPTAVYASVAVLSFYVWHQHKTQGFLTLSLLALIFATWTRSDVIVFYPFIMLILFVEAVRQFMTEKKTAGIISMVAYGALGAFSFIVWHFYLEAHIERKQDSFFIKSLFYDGKKLHDVFSSAWTMLSNTNIYGLVAYGFIAAIILVHIIILIAFLRGADNKLFAFYKANDKYVYLLVLLGGWLLYTMLFYQMKNTDGSLFASGGWMLSGYKRGMFSFVPLAAFYCVANPVMLYVYQATDKWLNPSGK